MCPAGFFEVLVPSDVIFKLRFAFIHKKYIKYDVLSTHHNYGGSFAKKPRFYNLRSENRWNSPSFTLRQLSWVVNLGISTHQASATNLPAPWSYNYMSSVHPRPLPLPFNTHNQTNHFIFPHSFFTDNDLNFIWYLMFADTVFSIYRVSFHERR